MTFTIFKCPLLTFSKKIKHQNRISGNLVVKSKLPRRSGSSLEAVEPHPKKGGHKVVVVVFFLFFFRHNLLLSNWRKLLNLKWPGT